MFKEVIILNFISMIAFLFTPSAFHLVINPSVLMFFTVFNVIGFILIILTRITGHVSYTYAAGIFAILMGLAVGHLTQDIIIDMPMTKIEQNIPIAIKYEYNSQGVKTGSITLTNISDKTFDKAYVNCTLTRPNGQIVDREYKVGTGARIFVNQTYTLRAISPYKAQDVGSDINTMSCKPESVVLTDRPDYKLSIAVRFDTKEQRTYVDVRNDEDFALQHIQVECQGWGGHSYLTDMTLLENHKFDERHIVKAHHTNQYQFQRRYIRADYCEIRNAIKIND